MAQVSTNMALNVWNLSTDTFNHTELASNLNKIDAHDHTTGKGVQIPAGGIAANAVITAKIQDGAVTGAKIADALKPSAGAAAGTEALRAIGTSASTVVAGNDSRLTDRRAPSIPFVSTLPGSPVDGQVCAYVADAASGVVWFLEYRSADASSYKWNCIGGGQLYANVDTQQTLSGAGPGDLTTVGPQITVPLAGEYMIQGGGWILVTVAGSTATIYVKNGAATPSSEIVGQHSAQSVNSGILSTGSYKITVASAATNVRLQYASTGTGAQFGKRQISARPIRVG